MWASTSASTGTLDVNAAQALARLTAADDAKRFMAQEPTRFAGYSVSTDVSAPDAVKLLTEAVKAGAQGFGRVLAIGPDVAGTPEERPRGPHEEDVVAERVDRPAVAERVVEVDAEDRDIHGEHAAGVVADH